MVLVGITQQTAKEGKDGEIDGVVEGRLYLALNT